MNGLFIGCCRLFVDIALLYKYACCCFSRVEEDCYSLLAFQKLGFSCVISRVSAIR